MTDPSPPLADAGRQLLAANRLDDYIAFLCAEGLGWWFDMKIPEIAAHLAPLAEQGGTAEPPPRLRFLGEAVRPALDTAAFEGLYHRFRELGDLEGAVAAACAGSTSIWDSGVNFERFLPWQERILALQNADLPISGRARAALLCFRAQIELALHGDMEQALASYRELMVAAEKAGSPSLILFGAAGRIYPLIWLGRPAAIAALTMSAAPLAAHPEVSLFARVYFLTSAALGLTVAGDAAGGEAMLRELAARPFFPHLPPSIRFLALGHLLNALAFQNKVEETEHLAADLVAMAAPLGNSFHTSYAHYCVGVALLLVGQPAAALAHAREAALRGLASASPIPARMNPLLIGQALADLGRNDEAGALFGEWVETWRKTGFFLHAGAGLRELAVLALAQGRTEEARGLHLRAAALFPDPPPPPQPHRSPAFLQRLEREFGCRPAVFPAPEPEPLLRIRTFGGLEMTVAGTTIYDRDWHGLATKKLLKAILSLGGRKISLDTLADLLWPDADGAGAQQNLKVAIHRLRRIGLDGDAEPPPWLAVRHRCLSLTSLCSVDSLVFERALAAGGNGNDDPGRLAELLALYLGDYLAHDDSEPWIVHRRDQLRQTFVRGVLRFADLAGRQGASAIALPILERAVAVAPLREDLYEALMTAHLALGCPSRALLAFREAERLLRRELGVGPGDRLTRLAAGIPTGD